MKKQYILLAVIAVSLIITGCSRPESANDITASSARSNDVVWYPDLSEGLALAGRERKPVVIDFYADWCKWCKVMDEETFTDPEVAKKLKEDYICVRVDTEKDPRVSQQFGVTGLPTLVFMTPDAEIITKIPGYIEKDTFLPILSYIKGECYLQQISFEDYLAGKRDCDKKE